MPTKYAIITNGSIQWVPSRFDLVCLATRCVFSDTYLVIAIFYLKVLMTAITCHRALYASLRWDALGSPVTIPQIKGPLHDTIQTHMAWMNGLCHWHNVALLVSPEAGCWLHQHGSSNCLPSHMAVMYAFIVMLSAVQLPEGA